jgi:formylglycine-generating enzyme required for sulfatase activity
MVVLPSGKFTMGSTPAQKSWAVSHGAGDASVADEAPQHDVAVRSFAIGKYDVTRGQYALFVRETHHTSDGDCVDDRENPRKKLPGVTWRNPPFEQTARDPVVCVSWNDAQAYVS